MGIVWNLLAGTVGEWVKAKAGIAVKTAEARANAVANGIPGYSDEWLVLVWSLPVIGVFIPGLAPHVADGFERLALLPEWYVGGFMTITAAVFGVDKWLKVQGK